MRTLLVVAVAGLALATLAASLRRTDERSATPALASTTPPSVPSLGDFHQDGTPDFLRLGGRDEQAFRRWFTFLAEAVFFTPASTRPREVSDCAALLRFAYREALRPHSGEWAGSLALPLVPAYPPVAKWTYPRTPLGTGLFRVRGGAFQPGDLSNGAFTQFADADTLRRWNTHFVSRDLRQARSGDLLFYEQPAQSMPFHAMVFVGRSHFEAGPEPWVVYHTGPTRDGPGDLRRLTTGDLARHPGPQWHPAVGNPRFLGVWRWNLVRTGEL